jgi:hypothetical protein
MMAAVFLVQPLGQILGAAGGWVTLASFGHSQGLVTSPNTSLTQDQRLALNKEVYSTIESIWRCVIGVQAFPALLATLCDSRSLNLLAIRWMLIEMANGLGWMSSDIISKTTVNHQRQMEEETFQEES